MPARLRVLWQVPHPEREGCRSALCRLHWRQEGIYGCYFGDKEPIVAVIGTNIWNKVSSPTGFGIKNVTFWCRVMTKKQFGDKKRCFCRQICINSKNLLSDAVCVIYCLIVFYGISVQVGNVPWKSNHKQLKVNNLRCFSLLLSILLFFGCW